MDSEPTVYSQPASNWPAALAFVPLFFCAGCLAWVRPSADTRQRSFAESRFALTADPNALERGTYHVFSSEIDVGLKIGSRNPGGSAVLSSAANPSSPVVSGLAVALTADGYLLTAGHVTGKYCYVFGAMGGRLDVRLARVVRRDSFRPHADLAILKVDGALDFPVARIAAATPGMRLFALASDRVDANNLRLVILGGVVRSAQAVNDAGPGVSVITTNLPLWFGDSGGPVFNGAGELVGINDAFSLELRRFRWELPRFVCSPSKKWIDAVIAGDRGAAPGGLGQEKP